MKESTIRSVAFWLVGLPKVGEPQRYTINNPLKFTVDGVRITSEITMIDVNYYDAYAKIDVYVRVEGSSFDSLIYSHTTSDIVEVRHDALFPDGEHLIEYHKRKGQIR